MPGLVHIVDEDASFLTAIERRLKQAGYEVGTYPSALDLLVNLPAESVYPLSTARQTKGRREAYSAQIPAEPPAGESPVTDGFGALRIAGPLAVSSTQDARHGFPTPSEIGAAGRTWS
jgi:hypothetical protein